MTNSSLRTIRAGEAFLEEIKKDPTACRKMLGRQLALKSVGEALQPALAENKQQSDAELKRLAEEFKVESEALDAKWEQAYGKPYPQTIDDWKQWLARADIPGRFLPAEKTASGKWTPADILPYIQGHLQSMIDAKTKLNAGEADENPDDLANWSPPEIHKKWATRFKVSEKSLHNWRANGTLRMKKVPGQRGMWRVHIEDPRYIEWAPNRRSLSE